MLLLLGRTVRGEFDGWRLRGVGVQLLLEKPVVVEVLGAVCQVDWRRLVVVGVLVVEMGVSVGVVAVGVVIR